MIASYKELLQQREALEQQINAAREAELKEVKAKVKEMIEAYGLTQADIFPAAGASSRKGSVVAPKYRDPATGKTWTGRGKPPTWISGQDRDQFLIPA